VPNIELYALKAHLLNGYKYKLDILKRNVFHYCETPLLCFCVTSGLGIMGETEINSMKVI
jgi:hypothetical protein